MPERIIGRFGHCSRIWALLLCLGMASLELVAQGIRYSPRWFGAYAQPVPELQDAQIPAMPSVEGRVMTTIEGAEQSQAMYLDVEIPLIPEAVSMRLYGYPIDRYAVPADVAAERGSKSLQGSSLGDLYLQSRIRLLRERVGWRPNLVLDITLKTAAATSVAPRRSFDTPGYYFHLEGGKSYRLSHNGLWRELRLSGMLGFMCWETSGSKQDDAYLYGLSLALSRPKLSCGLELSGYTGWLYRHDPVYGDRPITLRMRVSYTLGPRLRLLAGYERGLRDYPYSLLSLGLRWQMPWSVSNLLH